MKGVLRLKSVAPLEEGDEAAAPTHAAVLVSKNIELVHSTKLLEEFFERLLVHGPRHLTHKHLDGVVVRDVGGIVLPGVAVLLVGSQHLILEVGRG